MTIRIGESSAKTIGDNHEKDSTVAAETEVDLNNNAYGRNVAGKGSEESAKERCRKAALDADLCSRSKAGLCVIEKPLAPTKPSSPPPPPKPAGLNLYTVKAGDTLSSIAQAKGTTVSALLAANPSITNPDKIYVGQVLGLPKDASGASGRKLI